MRLPFDEWQFYVVTAVALVGLWLLVRPFLSRRKHRTTALTIEGATPPRSSRDRPS